MFVVCVLSGFHRCVACIHYSSAYQTWFEPRAYTRQRAEAGVHATTGAQGDACCAGGIASRTQVGSYSTAIILHTHFLATKPHMIHSCPFPSFYIMTRQPTRESAPLFRSSLDRVRLDVGSCRHCEAHYIPSSGRGESRDRAHSCVASIFGSTKHVWHMARNRMACTGSIGL